MALILGGCTKEEEPSKQQIAVNVPPGAASTPAASSQPSPSSTTDPGAAAASGFDISRVPVANQQLGKFPYVSLIEGYQRSKHSSTPKGSNKDVDFDRYEFFDGAKIITVEGRLSTTEAEGQGASAFQVFKTYESLFTGLGGVKVFEGKGEQVDKLKLEFSDERHRFPVYSGDQLGVYAIRMPDKEVWLEAYVRQHGKKGTYFLTVVEKKALDVKASLLPAEEMKRELDTKGHVALYINFDFDKADIRPESRTIIDEIVKLLRNNPGLNLTVEGHTDNVGTPAYNKSLSDARARSVVTALTAQGVEARRLRAAGYGQERPIADNSTDGGRAQNRRVELVKVAS
ncbi:MAG: OmpA family protein [Verrucomicrobiota bacterium]|nr:OmpA family protein [Verrucomicrobiota bacterium]